MNRTWPIDGELLEWKIKIEAWAKEYGLDFFETIFEVCDYDTVNILASQGGFPLRYPHWKFGMEYDRMSKSYTYGLHRIYEMVINTDPCYAYLLNSNNLVDQKTVMAHVYGHNDFFKNNAWFANTNRKMMDAMANHGTKVRRYMELHGQDKVESFIDRVLSIENLLDINQLFETPERKRQREELERQARHESHKGEYLNDDRSESLKSFIRSKQREIRDADNQQVPMPEEDDIDLQNFPASPVRDVMGFLILHAPLEEWQADVLGILREEAYYFLPQRITKIMNEGWASYWHSTIMTQKALDSNEVLDFADHHAGVMAMSKQQINPYKVGIELLRDIEYRWDTGRFGKEYNECKDMNARANWDMNLGLGREKIFEVRKTHNDISFIDEFLTPEFCQRQQIFTYKYNQRTKRFEVDQRDFEAIKTKLLTQLTNFGTPVIEVDNANYENRGELLLGHRHDGVDLDGQFAQATIKNLYYLWKRPVHLRTLYEDKETIISFDGKKFETKS